MKRIRRFGVGTVIMLSTLAVLLVMPMSASAAGTLDQAQTTTTQAAASVGGSTWWAQTFTAGLTGNLDQVDLFLFRVGSPGDLTVQIQSTSGGVPSGSVLATTMVAEAAVTQSAGGSSAPFSWVSAPLSPAAQVVAGQQYAIVLSAPSATGINFYAWGIGSFDSPYPAGKAVLSLTGGAAWGDLAFIFDSWDTAFKTYVTSLPSSIADCQKDGWRNFPQFKNEGDCVSFVVTGGKNQPG
jgi:hypothetical protein